MTSSRASGNRESSTLRLDMAVKFLKGIGERRAEQLERLGIRTARDLLWHLPHRYVDASTVTPLVRAEIGQEVACVGRVVAKGVLPTRRGLRIFHAVLRDDSGVLECVWPGQAFLDRTIAVGQTLLVSGPVRFYHGRQLAPREYVILSEGDAEADPLAAGKVLPVYPATEGLSHRVIRSLIDRHLDALIERSDDPLPETLRQAAGLPRLADALRAVHRPASAEEAERGRRRLAFDELLDLQPDLAQIDVEVLQHVGGHAAAFLDQAQQDVLGADVFVIEPLCLLIGQLHDLAGAVGKTLVHARSP